MINNQIIYLISINPPINNIVNTMVKILKYLSMNNLMGLPNFQINPATRKNRADLLMADAIRKLNKLMSKAPAVIVNIL